MRFVTKVDAWLVVVLGVAGAAGIASAMGTLLVPGGLLPGLFEQLNHGRTAVLQVLIETAIQQHHLAPAVRIGGVVFKQSGRLGVPEQVEGREVLQESRVGKKQI